MENKYLRIIANPYLLKKPIEDHVPKEYADLLYCLSKKYDKISYNDIENIMALVDEYFIDKLIKDFINDIIDDVIEEN